MAENIDQKIAQNLIERAWQEIETHPKPPPRMAQLIETILGATDITFKYLLVTGFLGKCANPRIQARALQAGSTLTGAYDARSLCHGVIVGFEKSKGNLFGLSNEPFLNKPARHPEHDGDNPQIRNKLLSKKLHEALELANSSSKDEVFAGLVHILRIGATRASETKAAIPATEVNLGRVSEFIRLFLQETDGGSRLVAVWGAFMSLLSENGEVKVYSPNSSDYFGKTKGDVELFYDDVLVSASECKQRPLTIDDVHHGLKKALEHGVPEYLFVYSAGLAKNQDAEIQAVIKANSSKLDVELVDIWEEDLVLVKVLNPLRRARFGETVVELLRQMRKFDTANTAANLWNKIKG